MKRKTRTRQDVLQRLHGIRLGDLPVALRDPIAELLATFAEGHLYDNYTDGVNKQAMAWLEVGMQRAIETVTHGELPEAMQKL
jgi:hypothetical protein